MLTQLILHHSPCNLRVLWSWEKDNTCRLVKKIQSSWSLAGTWVTIRNLSNTFSHTKKVSSSMCLVLECRTGLWLNKCYSAKIITTYSRNVNLNLKLIQQWLNPNDLSSSNSQAFVFSFYTWSCYLSLLLWPPENHLISHGSGWCTPCLFCFSNLFLLTYSWPFVVLLDSVCGANLIGIACAVCLHQLASFD